MDMNNTMTKQQAIKELKRRGWTNITPQGKFNVEATSPKGERGLFDPRDLLAELYVSAAEVRSLIAEGSVVRK
jgi:hypothetical protein